MKKLLALLLAICLVFSLVACGEKKDASNNSSNASAKTDFIVGAIYITSQNDTAGYTYAHHNGITTAMKSLGLSESDLKIVDNVPEDKEKVATAIDTLAGQGCNIIFGISFGYIDAFTEAASKTEYSDIVFSHATGYMANNTNYNNYFGRIYQARYLSGIAAGLKSLELGSNNLGYVAAWGTEYAETCSGINAFALGAQSVNPDAVVHVNKISTWGDEAKEKAAAQALIDTYKVCVIAQHCDSAQPQMVAADAGIFGCGYNSNMTEQAPKAHLTAPVWNWDVYYELAIETAKNEPTKFMEKVGVYYGGLRENFVDISPLTSNCTAETASIIDKVKSMMINGEWDVFSNIKLSISKDGTITKTESAIMDNKGAEVLTKDGKLYTYDNNTLKAQETVDGVIKGSMNYYVAGVVEG